MIKSAGQIIRRYASALYELANESGKLNEARDEISNLNAVLDDATVDFLSSPRFDEASKKQVIDLLTQNLKLSQNTSRFLSLVVENKRAEVLKQVLASFLVQADEKLGIARAEIISAAQLSADELAKFQSLLSSTLKMKIEVSTSIDPSLKAGTVIKLGNTIVDASLRTRLANLKESLSVGV